MKTYSRVMVMIVAVLMVLGLTTASAFAVLPADGSETGTMPYAGDFEANQAAGEATIASKSSVTYGYGSTSETVETPDPYAITTFDFGTTILITPPEEGLTPLPFMYDGLITLIWVPEPQSTEGYDLPGPGSPLEEGAAVTEEELPEDMPMTELDPIETPDPSTF